MLMLGLGTRLKLAYLVGPTRLESKRGARSCATFGKLPRTRIDFSIHQRQGGCRGGVAGKSKHARWCLQLTRSRIQAHIQVNRLFGQLSFTAKSGVGGAD